MLDQRHRAHARIEQRIRDARDTGLANLPSADFAINSIWLQLVLAAEDLLAFLAVLALDGDLATAEPKTIRYRLLHVAGRLTTTALRMADQPPGPPLARAAYHGAAAVLRDDVSDRPLAEDVAAAAALLRGGRWPASGAQPGTGRHRRGRVRTRGPRPDR